MFCAFCAMPSLTRRVPPPLQPPAGAAAAEPPLPLDIIEEPEEQEIGAVVGFCNTLRGAGPLDRMRLLLAADGDGDSDGNGNGGEVYAEPEAEAEQEAEPH